MDNKLKILFAEDEPLSQLLIERMLKKAGHSVTLANNGREALDFMNVHTYDLCIFDMQMPVMNGIEAVTSYKKKLPKSKLPFIFLTANTEKDAVEQCKKAGVGIHLVKPIMYKALIEAIKNAIGTRLSVSTSSDSIIDITQLNYYENQKFLDEFIEIFEVSVEKLTKNLGDALDSSYKNFMNIVHSIKGLSGNVGATALREITIKAEALSEDDYKKKSNEHYNEIVDELFRVKKELVKFSSSKIE